MGQLQEIERYIDEGDVEAIAQCIDFLKQSTDFDLLYEAAAILLDSGFIEEADKLYDTLLLHLPNEAQLKIDRAGTLLELGNEDAALLLLTEIGPQDEEYVQALVALADYYQMSGMAEAALEKIKEANTLAPNEPILLFAYAELLLHSGKYGEAARLYHELKKESEEIGGIRISARLAETYSAGAAYEEAIPFYEELLKESILPDTLFGAAFAYFQSGNAGRSITLLENLIEIDPDYFSAYMLLGQAHALSNDDQKAYETFIAGLRRDEYDKELRLAAGKSALKLGLPEEAEEHLQEALALDPEYIDALITLASLYDEKERNEDLLDLLSLFEELNEEFPLLEAFKAYAYEREEQFKDAYVSYGKAYGGMREDSGFLASYAKFLIEEGKRQEALEIVKQLVMLVPDDQYWRAFLEAQDNEEV